MLSLFLINHRIIIEKFNFDILKFIYEYNQKKEINEENDDNDDDNNEENEQEEKNTLKYYEQYSCTFEAIYNIFIENKKIVSSFIQIMVYTSKVLIKNNEYTFIAKLATFNFKLLHKLVEKSITNLSSFPNTQVFEVFKVCHELYANNQEIKDYIKYNNKVHEIIKILREKAKINYTSNMIDAFCGIIKTIDSCDETILLELGMEHLVIRSLIELLRLKFIYEVVIPNDTEIDLIKYYFYGKGYKLLTQLGYTLSEINYFCCNGQKDSDNRNFINDLIKYKKHNKTIKSKSKKEGNSETTFTLKHLISYVNDNNLPLNESDRKDFSFRIDEKQ